MSGNEYPNTGRKRGYSLRTQLFFKNALKTEADVHADDPEMGITPDGPVEDRIELSNLNSSLNLLETTPEVSHQNNNRSSSDGSTSDDATSTNIRHGPMLRSYAGKRGRIQKRFTDMKNLVMNVRPYRKSKDGRKIPISVMKDFDTDEFPVTKSRTTHNTLLVDERYKKPYTDNVISSSRYSIYSFLPKQLYAQFSKLANAYFLTVSILQMIPSWSTTGTYTTIVPLLIFITISMLREGFDDWRRHLQDKKENGKFTRIITHKGHHTRSIDDDSDSHSLSRATSANSTMELASDFNTDTYTQHVSDELLEQPNTFTKENYLKQLGLKVSKVRWKDLRVGDIVKLQQDEPVPADFIILTSDGQNENEVFVETMDLDGETNLKSKLPHRKISAAINSAAGLKSFKGAVTIEDPNTDLYNFEGNIKMGDEIFPLGPDNIVYRGSIIRNTKNVVGLVVFTGEESKIRMNAIKNPRTKAPKLQRAINLIVAFMVLVVFSLSMFSFMAQRLYMHKYWDDAWYLYNQEAGVAPTIMSFIIMYNTLIPLSLYVTTEIIKVVQMLFLHWDIDMYHLPSNTPCEVRTATILEELGQVSYVFSDKTGTLTDNLMIFRKFSVAGTAWSHDLSQSTLEQAGVKKVTDSSTPRGSIDIRRSNTRYSGRPSLASALSNRSNQVHSSSPLSAPDTITPEIKTTIDLLTHIQHNPNTVFSKKAKFFILSLALCHTCLPKTVSEDTEEIEYQSSSPDELALVVAARDMGYVVYGKNHKNLTIRTYPDGMDEDPVDETYEVLNVVEFSSARKRMSIIVKFPDGRICMICKGADNIILERLRNTDLAKQKKDEVYRSTSIRKANEAQLVLHQRQSSDLNGIPRKSSQLSRHSLGVSSVNSHAQTIDDFVLNAQREQNEINEVAAESRKSLQLRDRQRYNITSIDDYIGNDKSVLNEGYVLEKTLEHIEEFSTEGLRTLLYCYKWLDKSEYDQWALDYASAKTSLVNRAKLIEEVGCRLEDGFELLGATAIEDKLQDGVADTIEKLRRAGIKLWMLTGDKRETAINIGYSCKLIKDYSSLVILDAADDDLTAKMTAAELEISSGSVAHCVVVIDGATLGNFEADQSMMSIFISLCTKTDSVICCRASPSQKALMVSNIRALDKSKVSLAIGDGANDIAMIQSADIGIGITGKEGLQAARSSDYSIAQFRYLQKLLLVHGRFNYIRTSKFVLATFYKELLFYLSQCIFQRNVMFTGTSLYEPWSLSMFNTLFTSLPVLCIGMFEKDLKPATLLAAPELYSKGRLHQGFNLRIFVGWMVVAASTSLLITFSGWYIWGFHALLDNSLYPMGTLNFTAIIFTINLKLQLLEQHNRTWLNAASILISCLGWLLWCCLLPGLYKEDTSKIYDVYKGFYWKFGKDITWWAATLITITMPLMFDTILQVFRHWFFPTEVDEFQVLEKNTEVRRNIELAAYDQMEQGWKWEKDETSIKRMYHNRKRKNTVTTDTELPPGAPSKVQKNSSTVTQDGYETEVLPSGQLVKRRIGETSMQKLGKKLRFTSRERDEDIDAIIEQRMRDLE
ncbi:CYFA0S05e00782g1_1 [Cyberlindnera fabianii]|uniref:Phospholipid-transporting ATPase n=1 Tax=Cyberlindnera fabianii TaxID=36022 RepID=A0A061AYL4_CYBFA|nr:putative phospholipid-transporting ATPase DNF3 [Cyberlindnera fabianii]CDR40459.1 CYFA0S05e00782g1_1 [Cyberlindnera fabianii]